MRLSDIKHISGTQTKLEVEKEKAYLEFMGITYDELLDLEVLTDKEKVALEFAFEIAKGSRR